MARDVEMAKAIYIELSGLSSRELDIRDEGAVKRALLEVVREIIGKSDDGKRDLLFEALCTAMGADWKQMPKHEAAKYNVAAQQLREIHATPAEVIAKARRYEFLHPDWPLTPTALISHWSSLSGSTTKKRSQQIFREDEPEVETVPPPADFLEALKRGPIVKDLP